MAPHSPTHASSFSTPSNSQIARPRITVINASLGGRTGNTGGVLAHLEKYLEPHANLHRLVLRDEPNPEASGHLLRQLEEADAFVIATGTYWDSWGSLLQRFLEEATESEGTSLWLGKPVAALVTMHAVGGKQVLSTLQGVLGTMGCLLPPMSGMVYSLSNHLALQARGKDGKTSDFAEDLWQLRDLEVIGHNLLEAVRGRHEWKSWPVDAGDARRRWF
jgi:NAD(P)H-dependent FMN reductase